MSGRARVNRGATPGGGANATPPQPAGGASGTSAGATARDTDRSITMSDRFEAHLYGGPAHDQTMVVPGDMRHIRVDTMDREVLRSAHLGPDAAAGIARMPTRSFIYVRLQDSPIFLVDHADFAEEQQAIMAANDWYANARDTTKPDHKAPRLWCTIHNHAHVPNIPTVTWGCLECGWGQWLASSAQAHAAEFGHVVHAIRHDLVSMPEQPFTIDAAHLERQRAFSDATFGPDPRTAGVIDHIRKELIEVEAKPDDVTEWADVIILAFDGATRRGFTGQQILDAVLAKQQRNEARTWPDWRPQPTDKAIEHDRTGEPTAEQLQEVAAILEEANGPQPGPHREGFWQQLDVVIGRYVYCCAVCGDEAAYCDGTRHQMAKP